MLSAGDHQMALRLVAHGDKLLSDAPAHAIRAWDACINAVATPSAATAVANGTSLYP